MKLVECVPNFSEGRDAAVLDSIADAIRSVDGAALLDMDPGGATNRTVVTIVGPPEAVSEAAFRAIKRASERIDMAKHKGAHARMGATDVCPFIPVSDLTMEECVELARALGRRVGDELGIPVYLYEKAASRPERVNLADVRKGEYEGLVDKLRDPDWKPDFGPAAHNARSGATAIGAREFLIAYNVNLNTRNKALAHDIALDIREQGRFRKDENGKFVRNAEGKRVRQRGRFKNVKAVGWYIDEYDRAQISINLTNHHVSPMHEVFDDVAERAMARGLRVTGSEIVGLVPLDAMLAAGRHYLGKQGESTGVPEARIVEAAVASLGLAELAPFDPNDKIIEYRIRRAPPLASLQVSAFTEELASDSPAPGGGSVAALAGSLSAALSQMVAHLTYGKKDFAERKRLMNEIAERANASRAGLLATVDADTDAFNAILDARRLPRKTDADVAARETAIRAAEEKATRVPLFVLEASVECAELAREVVTHGNPNSLSDGGVAGLLALACAEGAYYNVLINLGEDSTSPFAKETRASAAKALARTREVAEAIQENVLRRLEPKGG